jgi:hypothetical protein
MIQDKLTAVRIFRCSLLVALALTASAGVTAASAEGAPPKGAPRWDIITSSAPTHLLPGEKGWMRTILINLGDEPVEATEANPVSITDTLPKGVTASEAMYGKADSGATEEDNKAHPERTWKCKGLSCTYVGTVPPLISLEVWIPVIAGTKGEGGENEVRVLGENEVRVGGANAPPKTVGWPIKQGGGATPFGVERYELNAENENGSPDLEAGSHPFQLTTTLELNQTDAADPAHPTAFLPAAPAQLRNLNTKLPPGLIGNTTVIPQCSEVDFSTIRAGESNTCPADTAVGAAVVTFKEPIWRPDATETVPVFNLVPTPGEPARFGFVFYKVPVILDTSVQTGEGYAVQVKVANASEVAEVLGTVVTIWGVPGDARHDNARGWECIAGGFFMESLEPRPGCTHLEELNPPPYLTLPTSCAQPLATSVEAQSWQPGAGLLKPVEPPSSESLEDCNKLPFEPSIKVTPDQRAASTPSGLEVEVKVPQGTTLAAEDVAEADIKDTTVALPEGMAANPGAANGLQACSVQAAGFSGNNQDSGGVLEAELEEQKLTSSEGVSCPNGSKIGEVAIHSPELANELTGFVYLGQQDTNPFASPLVLYLIAEDPVSGVRVKLAGEVRITSSGQLVSVFKNTPPLPFETLTLRLFDGARAAQSTPSLCRSYETTASFVPWSGEETAQRSSSFTPESGPNGTPCQTQGPLPFSAGFQAGSTNNQAGGFTPFTLTINRPDGDQALKSITMHLPPGLAAVLASVTPCPEPQASNDECGSESLIGHSTASSGLGSDPVTLGGDVYLTGPYEGAPFGLLTVTHARACDPPTVTVQCSGPFNLGDIPVRSTITIDPNTAAATITSDPLPQFVKGVPSEIKQLNVTIERPGFQFNPTNCSPMAISGTLTGYDGASETVSSPFEVANCASLPFKPTLTATVGGQASKENGASFDVKIESAGLGQADIHKVDLTLPVALPSRLTTIQKACPVATFNASPTDCDEGSVIGEGIVYTPVFKNPLRGKAYLVGHAGEAFPDTEFVLKGEGVTLVLDGKTNIKNGITYSRFETNPDAPFTKFEAIFPTGPHSALTAYVPTKENYNLCKTSLTMPTEIAGQNGTVIKETTTIAVTGCKGVAAYKASSAELLAKALKVCKKDKKKSKRVACEKKARKKYPTKAAKKAPKKATKKAAKKASTNASKK